MLTHTLKLAERVYDIDRNEWALIEAFPNGESTFVVTNKNRTVKVRLFPFSGKGKSYLTQVENCYQIAKGKTFQGETVCYEHLPTRNNYPYYCPSFEENLFEIELDEVPSCDVFFSGEQTENGIVYKDLTTWNNKDDSQPIYISEEELEDFSEYKVSKTDFKKKIIGWTYSTWLNWVYANLDEAYKTKEFAYYIAESILIDADWADLSTYLEELKNSNDIEESWKEYQFFKQLDYAELWWKHNSCFDREQASGITYERQDDYLTITDNWWDALSVSEKVSAYNKFLEEK